MFKDFLASQMSKRLGYRYAVVEIAMKRSPLRSVLCEVFGLNAKED
jgi:hypothetical protein